MVANNPFDLAAGGKVQFPTFNPASTTGNPNAVGADSMFGSSQALIGSQGNTFLAAGAGTNAGSGAFQCLSVTTIPGNSFDQPSRGLILTAMGSLNGAGSVTRVRLVVNPTTAVVGSVITLGSGVVLADTGAQGSGVAGAWALSCAIFKYGNPGSNTQMGIHQQCQVGGTVQSLVSPQALTINEAASFLVAVAGDAGTGGTATLNFFEVTACN